MDAKEFYTRKEDLLERLSAALSEAAEVLSLLKANEKKVSDPDRIFLEEADAIYDSFCDASDWTDLEWKNVNPMAEAARQAAKK